MERSTRLRVSLGRDLFVAGLLALTAAGGAARANESEPAALVPAVLPASPPPPPPRPRRFLVHANIALNVYTYAAATATAKEAHLTPAERITIFQILGFGWFPKPQLRVGLQLQFGESLSGLAPGASPFVLFSIIPWLVYHHPGGFFIGAGPSISPRAYGQNEVELGLFSAFGYAFKIAPGWAFSTVVQLPVTLLRRVTVAVSPTFVLSYRF